MAQPGGEASPSVVELVGHRLVEHEGTDAKRWSGTGYRTFGALGLGGIEGGSLVEEEISLRRAASG